VEGRPLPVPATAVVSAVAAGAVPWEKAAEVQGWAAAGGRWRYPLVMASARATARRCYRGVVQRLLGVWG